MSNNVVGLPLSQGVLVPSATVDAEYMNGDQPWSSVEEYLEYKDSQFATIFKNKTILVKQIDGNAIEMWNPINERNFTSKSIDFNYRPSTTSQKGYITLNPNQSFASQVKTANMVYEIQNDFDLNGSTVRIPENCALSFTGGSINNGTLILNNTSINKNDDKSIFKGITLNGTAASDVKLSFFDWDNEYSSINFSKLKSLYNIIYNTKYNVIYDIESIHISYNSSIVLDINKTYDFNNATIYAHSETLSRCLFTVTGVKTQTEYKKISEAVQDDFFKFKQGLILITDNTPLYTRHSNGQVYIRKDILLVQNNDLTTTPIMDYDTDTDADPLIEFMSISQGGFKFCNLKYDRTGSEEIAPLLWIKNCYKPEIFNLQVDSDHPIWKDNIEAGTLLLEYTFGTYIHDVSMNNCLGDVVGTNEPNYNISLLCAANVTFERIHANAKWHTFGNQCVNKVVCRDCILDQWDSHTYGRDYLFENCIFHTDHLGAPEVGFMKFINCKFIDSNIGYVSDSDVAVFPTMRIFEGCTFENQDRPLLLISPVYKPENPRHIIQSEKFPSLIIRDCIFNISNYRTTYVLYEVKETNNTDLINNDDIMADIYMDNVIFNTNSGKLLKIWLTDQPIKANIRVNGLKSNNGEIRLSLTKYTRGSIQIERCLLPIVDISENFTQESSFTNTLAPYQTSGSTSQRPLTPLIGYQYFDTTINKPIWWDGAKWIDTAGIKV